MGMPRSSGVAIVAGLEVDVGGIDGNRSRNISRLHFEERLEVA